MGRLQTTRAVKAVRLYTKGTALGSTFILTPPSGSVTGGTPVTVGEYSKHPMTANVTVSALQNWSLALTTPLPATQALLQDLWIELEYETSP